MINLFPRSKNRTRFRDFVSPDPPKPEQKEKEQNARKLQKKAKSVKDRLTESWIFRRVVDKAYRVCDPKNTNHISVDQLYSGLLLVHLNLAKYCGAAACMPPSRLAVEELFFACDVDGSGGIDRDEFNIIIKVSCAQIFSRVLINYATLIFVIPFIAKFFVDQYLDPEWSYVEMICIQFTSATLFMLIVPWVWKVIDWSARKEAGRQANRQKSQRNLMLQSDTEDEDSDDDDDFHDAKSTNGALNGHSKVD
mmetsp:Transcript_112711/g.325673  ORF Transcript_112711/g.325673 Transcript_112711/m.325673 type:complete len:251 (+) Transcript_112711:143-895(+)